MLIKRTLTLLFFYVFIHFVICCCTTTLCMKGLTITRNTFSNSLKLLVSSLTMCLSWLKKYIYNKLLHFCLLYFAVLIVLKTFSNMGIQNNNNYYYQYYCYHYHYHCHYHYNYYFYTIKITFYTGCCIFLTPRDAARHLEFRRNSENLYIHA